MGKEKKRKKKKKQKQKLLLKQKAESPEFLELLEVLEDLEREQKYLDVQICPHCKSPRVRRVGTMKGDMSSHIGLLPPKFECLKCGWRELVRNWDVPLSSSSQSSMYGISHKEIFLGFADSFAT